MRRWSDGGSAGDTRYEPDPRHSGGVMMTFCDGQQRRIPKENPGLHAPSPGNPRGTWWNPTAGAPTALPPTPDYAVSGQQMTEEEAVRAVTQNLRRIGRAITMYAGDHGSRPPADGVVEALKPYLGGDDSVFYSPVDGKLAFRYFANASGGRATLGTLSYGSSVQGVLHADGSVSTTRE